MAVALLVASVAGACGGAERKGAASTTTSSAGVAPPTGPTTTTAVPEIDLHSPSFADGGALPPRHAGGDQDLSPALEWTGVPDATAELALLCEDPDAPKPPFIHWVLAGIDPATRHFEEGDVPDGVLEGINSFGEAGWAGPQPQPGDPAHHYVFTLFALDRKLGLDGDITASQLRKAMNGKVLAEGRLAATFRR